MPKYEELNPDQQAAVDEQVRTTLAAIIDQEGTVVDPSEVTQGLQKQFANDARLPGWTDELRVSRGEKQPAAGRA